MCDTSLCKTSIIMRIVIWEPAWVGGRNFLGMPFSEFLHSEAKNCKLSGSNLHLEHIFGPKWFESPKLKNSIVKVKINGDFQEILL